LKPLFDRAEAELVMAEVTGICPQKQQILFRDRPPVDFDMLAIGVGSAPAGVEHLTSPLAIPIKPMQTFIERLERRLNVALESRAHPLRVAVVGGGVAGCEIALCLHQRLEQKKLPVAFQIEIFTGGSVIGEGLRTSTSRQLNQILSGRGIKVHLEKPIRSVQEHGMTTDEGVQIPSDAVIWATGAAAPAVLKNLSLAKDHRGFLATTPTLQTLDHPRIFAVGDCGTIVKSPSPKAGVYAVRQCPILWHNMNALADDHPLIEFQPQRGFLKLINTGDGRALLEYQGLCFHARWCLWLKSRIDKKFVSQYQ
jgi:NADH dehydrogenase FAD-containing subunit